VARIQTPQHVQELQAEFKIREPFGLELLETVQPVYAIATQRVASSGFPKKCYGRAAGTAQVGVNAEVALTCPTDVGIIILVTKVYFGDIAGPVQARADDGVPGTPIENTSTNKAFRDTRINPAQLPDGILQAWDPLTAAPNGRSIAEYECPANITVEIVPDVILGGGGYYLIRHLTANTALSVSYEWTEFLLEDR